MKRPNRWSLKVVCVGGFALAVLIAAQADSQEAGKVRVTFKDDKVVVGEPVLPIDPVTRVQIGNFGNPYYFGLSVDNKRITCSPQGSIWSTLRIDGVENNPLSNGVNINFDGKPINVGQLPSAVNGRKRIGYQVTWKAGDIEVTQINEVVPSKATKEMIQKGLKRSMDVCRVTYVLVNKGQRTQKVEFRTNLDILINNNDGALYASPTTHPGKILNGQILKDKELPEYLQVLEMPNLQNPGMVATMTLKSTKGESPSHVTLTNLGAIHQAFDCPAIPAGDSACAIYWEAKTMKPGDRRELTWAYGGGIASNPDNEGKVNLNLGGSFEPGKLFTITAMIDDPAPNQTLTLQLPEGMERVEGREIQPVPLPSEFGSSVVQWKGRVQRPGDFPIRVQSSTGVTQIKNVSIQMN